MGIESFSHHGPRILAKGANQVMSYRWGMERLVLMFEENSGQTLLVLPIKFNIDYIVPSRRRRP